MNLTPTVLRLLRVGLGETQHSFAQRIGLCRQSISLYEIGRLSPNEHTEMILRAFNIDADTLARTIDVADRLSEKGRKARRNHETR